MRAIIAFLLLCCTAAAVDYPIVAVRAPRFGDTTHTRWQEVFDPIDGEPGTDLVICHPNGTDEMLVDAGDNGVVFDPCVSLDGTKVYYAYIPDITLVNTQRRAQAARSGSDIWVIDLATRQQTQLTHQEWTPALGVVPDWVRDATGKLDPLNVAVSQGHYLGYGIYNTGPCEVPGGRLIFTSSRMGYLAPKGLSFPNLQLYSITTDGRNVEQVGHLNIGSALHPVLLKNGKIAWSSWEMQGWRDDRNWGLWQSYPDGREWGPLASAFAGEYAWHFATQQPDGKIACVLYYLNNNNGFGTVYRFPHQESVPADLHAFHSPTWALNPPVTKTYESQILSSPLSGYSPWGIENLTEFAHHFDRGAYSTANPGNQRLGKVTHPCAGPGEMLMVWSPGPANHNGVTPVITPVYQGKIVALPYVSGVAADPSEFQIVRENPAHNYQQPRPLLSWEAIYGEPATEIPWLPNDGTPALPEGTPFGIVGTSSVYHRNSTTNGQNPYDTIGHQGGDVGQFTNGQIHAIRIVQTEPQSHLSYLRQGGSFLNGDPGWTNQIKERLRIIGEVPLRKFDGEGQPILDPLGDPDTSFAAKIPADMPFTFQLIDAKGKALVLSQTWHQVRPGEKRVNCGGCHAHAEAPLDFATTAAADPSYVMPSLLAEPRDVEFTRDVLPILTARGCVECHTNGAGQVAFDMTGDVYTKVLTKMIRTSSRLSKIIHKLEGVTETGGGITGERMPPGGPYLSDAEVRTVAEWIDLGAANGSGVFTDNLPPTLTVTHPAKDEAASEIVIGAFDNDSRLNVSTLKVQIGDGTAPLTDITASFTATDNVWRHTLPEAMPTGELHVEVFDNQGNMQRVVRHFNDEAPPPVDPCEALQQQLIAVQAELAACLAAHEQDQQQITSLQQQVSELQAKIAAALEALD
jgi:hypothetical protein